MKLELTADQTSSREYALGNFRAKFDPGEVVDVENDAFAEYLLAHPEIKRAGKSKPVDETVTTDKQDAEGPQPTKRQRAEKN